MRQILTVTLVALSIPLLHAQDRRDVPKDSARVSIPGCAKGTRFIVVQTPGHEPVRSTLQPGRRFRLSGKKALLEEIKKEEGRMIEVTGLVRQSDLDGPGGVSVGGVRIGGGPPRAPVSSGGRPEPGFNEAMLDVEGWRPLTEPCPAAAR
jgi:hypothetical protein